MATQDTVPEGVEFSAAAAPKPHIISLFNPGDYSTTTLPCDLINLTVGQMKQHASQQFSLPLQGFDLLHNGNTLQDGCKAIDIGIGNGAVVVAQVKGVAAPHAVQRPAPVPQVPMPQLQQLPMSTMGSCNPMAPMGVGATQYQMYQMALANQLAAIQGQSASPLPSPHNISPAMVAAGPPPPPPPMFHQMPPSVSLDLASRSASGGSQGSLHSHGASTVGTVGTAADSQSSVGVPVSTEFCTYALTSDGSRALLAALQSLADPSETMDQLLPILQPRFVTLAVHHHASRVVMGIINLASSAQLVQLLRIACNSLVELCESTSGAEVLVSLVSATGTNDVFNNQNGIPIIVDAVAASLPAFCTSVNGRKVLQAILQKFTAQDVTPIYDAASAGMINLSTDQCGCITMQRLYDYSDPKLRQHLQAQMLECLEHLITDPYGNYVLQHAVKDNQSFSALIARHIKGRLLEFAVNKFSSNVIEKCMQTGPDDVRHAIISELCQSSTMQQLMQDAYGNYVVQSAVDNSPLGLLEQLKDAVLPLVGHSPYGYRIESKLQKRLKKGIRQRKAPADAAPTAVKPTRSPLMPLPQHDGTRPTTPITASFP